MNASTNAPVCWTARDINAPAGAGRVTLLTAQIGCYTLDIHDATGSNGSIHIVMWSVSDRGMRRAEGVADSVETAKVTAEQEACRLTTAAQSSVAQPCESGEHTNDPVLTAYLAWVAAANEANRTANEASNLTEGSPEWEAVNEACHNAEELSNDLMNAVESSRATTAAGVLAKLAFFTWRTSSCMYAADIRFWQEMIGDLAQLGIFPLETKVVSPFGEGRRFSPLHRAAMAKEGIGPTGRPDIAFATDVHRRCIGHGDANLLAAFDEWVRLERQNEASTTDDAAQALLAASNQFAQHQPHTMKGVLTALRFLFAVRGENPEHYETVLNGTEPSESALSDYRDRLLWNTIQAVERMQAGGRASK